MKNLFIFLLLLVTSITQAQNNSDVGRCLAATYYTKITPDASKRVNEACSVCFTDEVISVYIPELGVRTYTVDETNRSRTVTNGVVTEFFDVGNVAFQIVYGHPTKTVIISFTNSGDAYMIQAKGFSGTMEEYQSSHKIIIQPQQPNKPKKDSTGTANFKFHW